MEKLRMTKWNRIEREKEKHQSSVLLALSIVVVKRSESGMDRCPACIGLAMEHNRHGGALYATMCNVE